jgi:hypothetical protein
LLTSTLRTPSDTVRTFSSTHGTPVRVSNGSRNDPHAQPFAAVVDAAIIMTPTERDYVFHVLRAAQQRRCLAFLGLAILSLGSYVANETWLGWLALASSGLSVLAATSAYLESRAVAARPEVLELVGDPGSVIRVVSDRRRLRLILRSGRELRVPMSKGDASRMFDLIRANSPHAEFAGA